MSGISYKDNLKNLFRNATDKLQSCIGSANIKNAYLLQALITKGFRDQKYVSQYEALHPETIARKAKKGFDPRFLIEGDKSKSEDLWKSFEVATLGKYEAVVGTNAKYARAHEFGYEAGGIPARPVLGPSIDEGYEQFKENYKNGMREFMKQ
ncbi:MULTISPECIES: phage virion morphogenesis protein [Leptospira]|uniref:phage virion morphogenesis protein n=1 Tax=Leptospira TaxID=171 RepID=UPI0002BE2D9C|nr:MULTISPECIES: phage virion morphogenesis protein [Leptospira]EMJ63430.1 phage virion morphogenesis family protein [Leptospira sp. P2653]EMN44681.1 phage virion morphogenesis family protein [Leptospira weilii str. LNT 1234]QDK21547.1 phage morphogenesis protein [Leptospira weilii]QDK24951.1 phage morphogenesis protein [Leptospira weilii]QDK25511.1 phage morphogenesis protein [Leptospira weilii]